MTVFCRDAGCQFQFSVSRACQACPLPDLLKCLSRSTIIPPADQEIHSHAGYTPVMALLFGALLNPMV